MRRRQKKELLPPSDKIRLVLSQAESFWGVPPQQNKRHRRFVRSRWSAAYALRVGCGLSLHEVADILGIDHTIVVDACRKVPEVAKLEGWWDWIERLVFQLRGM